MPSVLNWPRQQIAIPAYFYPGGTTVTSWNNMVSSGRNDMAGSPLILAVAEPPFNVASPDTTYQQRIPGAQAAGLLVLAYVDSDPNNPNITVGTMQQEIDRAFAWYQVDGIFSDDTHVNPYGFNATHVERYAYLTAYAKTKRAGAHNVLTVINPGAVIPERYVDVADIIVNAETDLAGYKAWQMMGWEPNYPPGKFWHIVHGVTSATDMEAVVAMSRTRNAGFVFATDNGDYNTFPPSYWIAEMAQVNQ